MKKLLCAIFALACFANSHANLIENGDFSNSTAGFGFSDAPPDTLNIRISPIESGGNSLTYSAKAAQLGGLNFSEVKIDRSKDYVFKFRAKASKKIRIRLILMADDINYIYRREIAQFKLDEN